MTIKSIFAGRFGRFLFGVLLALQAFSAAFFLFDILSGVFGFRPLAWQVHELVEIGAALSLFLGVAASTIVLYLMRARTRRAEEGLRLASGAFHELVEEKFVAWALTPSERDVALFVIKGLTTAEIASARNTSEGTVKAQTNAIYRKSGVASRAQLVSLFVDDLVGGPIFNDQAPAA